MSAKKSRRLSIRSHNIQFLEALGSQMGITDLSEVINYLILDCKGLGYTFGNKPQPHPQQQLQPIMGYAFDPETFESIAPIQESDRNQIEVDPIIARMAALLEEF